VREADLASIVEIQLEMVARHLERQGMRIEPGFGVVDFLGVEGDDPTLGSRRLKPLIECPIIDPLSLKLLGGEIKPGDCIGVFLEEGKFAFRVIESGDAGDEDTGKCS
jgi:ATP-dependent Clp protease ATP-binding subunit ClpB